MAQSAKQKEDTRSVKLIKAQSNQAQQLLAEKEALGEKLGKKEEEIAILRKNATSSRPSPEESYWFNDDGLSSEHDEADYLEG